jgi:hypothetical protein
MINSTTFTKEEHLNLTTEKIISDGPFQLHDGRKKQ